jgi:choloylglycine hydrolase
MCTAISFTAKNHYFGRNLDLEFSYGESVVVTPRRFPFHLRSGETISDHYAFIGTAFVTDSSSGGSPYPLYYDATNEAGLSMAGLNFVGNAHFYPPRDDGTDIAQFELIPYILGTCRTVDEAICALYKINLVSTPFSPKLPPSELHYMIADRKSTIVIEPLAEGLKIYDDPVGVLTNNPPFPFQLENLGLYLNLTSKEPEFSFGDALELVPTSRGVGAFGLPGDASSPSRFVRAAFMRANSTKPDDELLAVSQFFHLLDSVAQVEGSVRLDGGFERTQYSSCCNTERGVYYYKTYENSRVTAVSLSAADTCGERLSIFPFRTKEDVRHEN